MSHLYSLLRYALLMMVMAIPLLASAGNIPMYRFSTDSPAYTSMTGMKYPDFNESFSAGTWYVFNNGFSTTKRGEVAEGLPIGFDFSFGGQKFNQFVMTTDCRILLGFDEVSSSSSFGIDFQPQKYGLSSASMSYKTSGTVGNRVCVVQWKNAAISGGGAFHLQIRLYEANGRIEYAFKETQTVSSVFFGMGVGIYGWSDTLYFTATGLNSEVTISSWGKPNPLETQSFITWSNTDSGNNYNFNLAVYPDSSIEGPSCAPKNLEIQANGLDLNVTCDRADDAEGTLILWSDKPFTDEDMPVLGTSYRAGIDDKGNWYTTIGNARVLYYNKGNNISVIIPNTLATTTYHIRAVSLNSHPAYGAYSDITYTTPQAAPQNLKVVGGNNVINLSWESDYPVIILATPDHNTGYDTGYTGQFGKPSADCNVGDVIDGGSTVVFKGNAQSFIYKCQNSRPVYFQVWNYDGNRLSAVGTETFAFPTPTIPFEPCIENYPTFYTLQGGWQSNSEQYMPMNRADISDKGFGFGVRASSVISKKEVLSTPELPLNTPFRLTFEYAMETVRDPLSVGTASIPQGNEPGWFGSTGFLKITADNTDYKTITEYPGSMETTDDNGYYSGTSTFEEVSIDFPTLGNNKRVNFEFKTFKTTYLYLRNIRIEYTEEPPKAPEAAPSDIAVEENQDGIISVSCSKGEDAAYTLILFSDKPITALPEDGNFYSAGSTLGDATVLYCGSDDKPSAATTFDMHFLDYNAHYFIAAFSGSDQPLWNTASFASAEYTSLPELTAPSALTAATDNREYSLHVTASRATGAEGTLILLSQGQPSKAPVSGTEYKVGDELGNASVIYCGSDESVVCDAAGIVPDVEYVLTAYSYNALGWWSEARASKRFTMEERTITCSLSATDKKDNPIDDAVFFVLAGDSPVELSVSDNGSAASFTVKVSEAKDVTFSASAKAHGYVDAQYSFSLTDDIAYTFVLDAVMRNYSATVTDRDGNHIHSAVVTVTDKDGNSVAVTRSEDNIHSFSLPLLETEGNEYIVSVSAEGYDDADPRTFSLDDADVAHEFVLDETVGVRGIAANGVMVRNTNGRLYVSGNTVVCDLAGRVVRTIRNADNVEVSSLAPGFYLVNGLKVIIR